MITELKLSNFRLFDDEVTVRFRPITVLIGRNNAGKTSIINFLLMLQQSHSSSDTQFLNPEGSKVHLGNFDSLKNTLTDKSELSFQLTARERRTSGDILWRYLSEVRGLKDIDSGKEYLNYMTNASISYEDQEHPLKSHEITLSYNGERVSKNRYVLNKNNKPFLDFSKEFEAEPKILENIELYNVEKEFIDAMKKNVNSLYHLLPIRQDKSERVVIEQPPSMTVDQRGEHTFGHLQRIVENENDSQYKFLGPHIENIVGIREIKFDKLSPSIAECRAVNKVTNAEVLIDDFGFGVSQCMPILVQGTIMPVQTSLMVEEPESHLHPNAQLALGSFFADLWKCRQVGSIIETHSKIFF